MDKLTCILLLLFSPIPAKDPEQKKEETRKEVEGLFQDLEKSPQQLKKEEKQNGNNPIRR